MTEEPNDEMLTDAAREYNKAGAVPREELWARIQAARAASAAAPAPPRRNPRGWIWPGAGVAALLVLSAGIAIGRRVERQESAVEGARSAEAVGRAAAGRNPADTGLILAQRLVLLQHLTGAEAAITSFRSAARQGTVDPQVAKWSRDLLGTTRMLRASTVASDPTMRRLLEDLDLVLAQIAAYTEHHTNRADELDLIEQSIAKRGVIARLRTSIPARLAPGSIRGI